MTPSWGSVADPEKLIVSPTLYVRVEAGVAIAGWGGILPSGPVHVTWAPAQSAWSALRPSALSATTSWISCLPVVSSPLVPTVLVALDRHGPAIPELGAVSPHLKRHRAVGTHFIVNADIRGESRAPPGQVVLDVGWGMDPESLRYVVPFESDLRAVAGRVLAIAHVLLGGTQPLEASIQGRSLKYDVPVAELAAARAPRSGYDGSRR